MKKILLIVSLSLACLGFGTTPEDALPQDSRILIQNTVLAKINDKTISVLDVVKQMEMVFYKNYPDLRHSSPARFQFYNAHWKSFLTELINTELISLDAANKELKLTDGEVREEMESRFGPNIILTLENIGLTYDEAWKIIKQDMIVKRMTWYYVHSKALQETSPQAIREAYKLHCEKNPPLDEWQYYVISVREDDVAKGEKIAKDLFTHLQEEKGFNSKTLMDFIKASYQDSNIQVSDLYKATSKDLSDTHRAVLCNLKPASFSEPVSQTSRYDQKTVYRIFYLQDQDKKLPASFDSLADELKEGIFQEAYMKASNSYIDRLRKYYGVEESFFKKNVPENFQPFSLP
jgi:hypothetical protein